MSLYFFSVIFVPQCKAGERKKLIQYFNALTKAEKDLETALDSIDVQMAGNPDIMNQNLESYKAYLDVIDKRKKEFELIPFPKSAKKIHQYMLRLFDIAKQIFSKELELFEVYEHLNQLHTRNVLKMEPEEAEAVDRQEKELQQKTQVLEKEFENELNKFNKLEEDMKAMNAELKRLAKKYNIKLK